MTGGRVTLSEENRPVVCIVSPHKNAYTETFIRSHIERLPARIRVLHGGAFPTHIDDDGPLLPDTLPHRLSRAFLQNTLGLPGRYFQRAALRRFLVENQVDVVLAEFGSAGVAVMTPCEDANVPLVVHFHGSDAHSSATLEREGRHYPELFDKAAAVIATSRDMERQLLSLGALREKLYYNPYGVDTTFFQGADPAKAPPVFIAVSRFVDKKGPHLTLLAFQRVTESVRQARLIMIGDGPLQESCKQLARSLAIDDLVEFHGPTSRQTDIVIAMRRARAFVQHSITTSYGDSEGTPVAVLEAGAAGLPVVATRHAGIKDAVIDGETGLLVDERDIEGMAQCMLQLAKDPDLAGRLGRAAREWVCANFSAERSIGNLWRIIESVMRK